jgi:hypothetical protein
VEDLGEPLHTCEACGYEPIRYVHRITHDQYPVELLVGCVCAENLTGDYVTPRASERRLKNRAARRAAWPGRRWRISAKGNSWLKHQGMLVTVFRNRRGPGWCASVGGKFLSGTFDTERAAKLATFDEINFERKVGGGAQRVQVQVS